MKKLTFLKGFKHRMNAFNSMIHFPASAVYSWEFKTKDCLFLNYKCNKEGIEKHCNINVVDYADKSQPRRHDNNLRPYPCLLIRLKN